jgi:hypothetical protein
MISNYEHFIKLYKEIDIKLKRKLHVYLIGGAVLLYSNLKSATKDIDIILKNKIDYDLFKNILINLKFKEKEISLGYKRFNLSNILVRNDFNVDIFNRKVCSKFILSDEMIKRSLLIFEGKFLKVYHTLNEDIILFKSMTEREGDLEDCERLIKLGVDWKKVLEELLNQIKISGEDIWVTWINERFLLLEERGLEIPIINKVNNLSENYYLKLEKDLKSKKIL